IENKKTAPWRGSSGVAVSGKQPGSRVGVRLLLRQILETFDAANNEPKHQKQQDKITDQYADQQKPDKKVQQADPEGPDLELIMALQPHWCITSVHIGDNHTDKPQKRNENICQK